MPDLVSVTAVEAALALEGLPAEARTRITNRLAYLDPSGPDHPCTRLSKSRIIAASLIDFSTAPAGELLGQEAAAMLRDLWSAPGVERVDRFWIEWNVLPPLERIPATRMQLAAQIDYDQPDTAPSTALQPPTRPALPPGRHNTPAGQDAGPLRWHYGPTDTDRDPARMWCQACGGEVLGIDGAYHCGTCRKTSAD